MRYLLLLIVWLATGTLSAHAAVGMMELLNNATSGPVTVFYPTSATETTVRRGDFELKVAMDSVPQPGISRLIVISHGSPGSPWVHFGLAQALVEVGFTVALPEHYADNYKDASDPGPPAWRRRPVEVSRAIDRLSQEPQFGRVLDLSRVGVFGMSAGGHTALTLAGGRWSPSRLRDHCRANLADDFHACAGPNFALSGGLFDGLKKLVISAVINRKLDDPSWYEHTDNRVAAAVAGVPFAADFDPKSLEQPKVKLALISARKDRWLVAQFHSDLIAAACQSCELLLDLADGGHGALLAPIPAGSSLSDLIRDPPGFDRHVQVPLINSAIRMFFQRSLTTAMQ